MSTIGRVSKSAASIALSRPGGGKQDRGREPAAAVELLTTPRGPGEGTDPDR